MNNKIGIDIHSLTGVHTGVAMYVRSVIEALAKTDPHAPLELFSKTDFPADIFTRFPVTKVRGKRFWTTVWLSWYWITRRSRPRVMLYPAHVMPLYSPMKSVVTIHDLAFELFPDTFTDQDRRRLQKGTRRSVQKADHLIAVSESAKNDIVRLYNIPAEKITVIYEGCDTAIFQPASPDDIERVEEKYGLSKPYILTVGTLQKRKNHIALVEALAFIKKRTDVDLVFAGGKGWLYDEMLRRIKELGLEDRVKLLGYVPDEDRPPLYSGATIFALPSLYEGFGLPVLEAMGCGVPVITGRNSSLTEVGGEAALYVDARSVDELASCLIRLLEDPVLRKKMREKGLAQAQKFRWEDTARQTLQLLKDVGEIHESD